jgi:hypothetical protein
MKVSFERVGSEPFADGEVDGAEAVAHQLRRRAQRQPPSSNCTLDQTLPKSKNFCQSPFYILVHEHLITAIPYTQDL